MSASAPVRNPDAQAVSREALNDLVQDHLHPAMEHALQATGWLQKTVAKAGFPFGRANPRQTIAFARDDLRDALRELDAFEAAVYPASDIRDVTDGESPGTRTEECTA